jgi:transcriptional regulator GlxA family with amidase domain
LFDQLQAQHPATRIYVESLGAAILAYIEQNYGSPLQNSVGDTAALAPQRLRLALDYIDANLDGGLSLVDIAKLVQLNVDYFIRAFRQTTGITPYRYVLLRRVERAKALLRESRCSMVEIALLSGFENQSNFNRAFKGMTGLTPGQFKRSL